MGGILSCYDGYNPDEESGYALSYETQHNYAYSGKYKMTLRELREIVAHISDHYDDEKKVIVSTRGQEWIIDSIDEYSEEIVIDCREWKECDED